MSYSTKTIKSTRTTISEFEFIALMACLMSNVALSIDAILPAIGDIGSALQITSSNRLQLITVMIFFGLGIGELIFGTLSDTYGRKPIVYLGSVIFMAGTLTMVWSQSLEILLVGRFFQGIGLSSARSVSIAIIRDTYSGNSMARVMSFISTVFLFIPMVAPILGQLILFIFQWKAILYFQLLFMVITIIWFKERQSETLLEEKRTKFSRKHFMHNISQYLSKEQVIRYTFITGLVEGAFISYLSASQSIFQDQYHLSQSFPYIFGGLALIMGFATWLNGILVLKYGILRIVSYSLILMVISSLLFVIVIGNRNPSLLVFIIFIALQLLAVGPIFGNMSALTMSPLGHLAGTGAAIFSFLTMIIGALVAIGVGLFMQNTVLPLFVGFLLTGSISILFMWDSWKTKNI